MGSQRVGHDWATLTLSLSPGKEMSQNLKPYRKLSFHDNSKGIWTAKRAENLAELLWLADSHLESSFLVECIEWHHVYTGRTINYMKTTLRKHLKTLFLHTLKALVAQSCLTLCDPMDCSSPGFSAHGILRQGHWRKWVSIPFPGDLLSPGIEPGSPALQVGSWLPESSGKLILKICPIS